MRLHRVRLINYRGVADHEVVFAAEGVTVVEGPNEVGKTSMPEGLDLVLDLLDSSQHRRVKSAKPVGRDAGPEVEVEMSSGPYRFVYRKRWLRRSETTLEIVSPRHEQLSGRAAHERVEEILDETLDTELWRALRVEQGTALALPGFDVPSLGRALDRAASSAPAPGQEDDRWPNDLATVLGDAESTPAIEEEDDLWTRICQERDRYWTATGRPKGARKAHLSGVEQARAEVSELTQQLDELDNDASEVSRLAAAARRLAATVGECEQLELELRGQWESTQRLCDNVERLAAAHEAALEKHARLANEEERRQETIRALDDRATDLAALEAGALQAAPALAAAVKQAKDAEIARDEARAALHAAEAEQRRADEDRDHHRQRIEVEQLTERHGRVIEAEEALNAAETRLASARVDENLVERIEQAHLAVVRAEAAVASVETTAYSELSMRIDDDVVVLGTDETQHTVVDDEVELVIPDVARIRVRAGTGSKSLGAERRNAHEEFHRLCETGGVTDLAEARRAAEERKEAERQRDEALKTIERDLRDLTIDVLRSKIEGLTERISSYSAERPADPPPPSDFEAAKQTASAKKHAAENRREEFKSLDRAARSAAETRGEAQLDESNLSGKIDIARSAQQQAAARLEDSRTRRADDEITTELTAAAQRASIAHASLEAAEAELRATNAEAIEVRLENAREAAKRARNDLRSNETRQSDLRFSLAVRGEAGLHTRHEEAVSRLRHLERAHEGTEARAQAATLLHDTFARHRQEARQRYVGPFKEQIERLGRFVYDSSFEVDIDGDLRVVRRTLSGDTLPVDQLSTGAVEQLGVLSRLACAAIVSPDGGGAPVIMDDALGWSDPDRLERMGAAIAAAGTKCQVIILTCTPGRYAHIGKATTVRLPS